jgi:hypothetical protein
VHDTVMRGVPSGEHTGGSGRRGSAVESKAGGAALQGTGEEARASGEAVGEEAPVAYEGEVRSAVNNVFSDGHRDPVLTGIDPISICICGS